ncbi:MAG: UDP-glucose 4-epimerase GalE, partial [Clostridia bacterium]|nr:UDP-glucose 4-epimerase GalE [Clostridia bacterium]
MNILTTGGGGYIGSHTVLELLNAGHNVTVLDNHLNSDPEALRRVRKITGKEINEVEGDVRDYDLVLNTLYDYQIDAVIHFAGLKSVGESVKFPLEYYDNNVGGAITLLRAMEEAGIRRMVFSSSATVYGDLNPSPLDEKMPLGDTTNPYGTTKAMIERIMKDLCASHPKWSCTILRYFNPVGAHESGMIGEDPSGVPNNLMPYVSQVAIGKRECLNVFGDDYDTPDGTGVRDFIHVVDLA